jgi:hypothetical protein
MQIIIDVNIPTCVFDDGQISNSVSCTYEVRRVLNRLADRLRTEEVDKVAGVVVDSEGNVIGSIKVKN